MKHFLVLLVFLFGCSRFYGCAESEPELPKNSEIPKEQSVLPEVSDNDQNDTTTKAPAALPSPELTAPLKLEPQTIRLTETRHLLKQKEFKLNLPKGFEIAVAAEGMRRVRFMAMSPDNRLFVTDMHDLSDNKKGKIYILEDFNTATRRYAKRAIYVEGLRNPNNVAFYVDKKKKTWLYVALTDALLRYPYAKGDTKPTSEPDTLTTFPDYGKSYREGGWHLTRTVVLGDNNKLYVSVGSSCNLCEEKEEVRATILEMNPDGTEERVYATGLRNGVGLRWVAGSLWATNMGADHLGLDKPEDNFYRIQDGAHYGWPYAYEYQGKIYADPVYGSVENAKLPEHVGTSWAGFPAHASPLGFDWFGGATDSVLSNVFLVALHGSGSPAMKRGYSIVRVGGGKVLGDMINGFLRDGKRYGRPCDILRVGENNFFFTDDYAGVVYFVYRSRAVDEVIREL